MIGTLGHSALIDRLVKEGKIDASAIQGKWESFIIEVVLHPAAGDAESALVIVGSDKRGTIYGIYDLSQQIGVSPWYWWADVPTAHHDNIFVKPGKYTQGSAGREISRHLFERRSARAFRLGPRKIWPGQAIARSAGPLGRGEHEPRVLRPRVRAAAAAARQLSLARHVEQRLQRRRSGKSQAGR